MTIVCDACGGRIENPKSKNRDKASEVIEQVTKEFGISACDINSGQCEDFAEEVSRRLPGSETTATEAYDPNLDEFPGHIWIIYKGKFYDSETPEGMKDWRNLPIFRRAKAGRA